MFDILFQLRQGTFIKAFLNIFQHVCVLSLSWSKSSLLKMMSTNAFFISWESKVNLNVAKKAVVN